MALVMVHGWRQKEFAAVTHGIRVVMIRYLEYKLLIER